MTSILLVDDDPNLVSGLRRALHAQPYELFTAHAADVAMEMFKRRPFHLVVADHQMPGMRGATFLSWVAEHFPDTIRILLTGHADVPLMSEAINECHVYRFLIKPCPAVELAMAIRDGLEMRIESELRWQRMANHAPPTRSIAT